MCNRYRHDLGRIDGARLFDRWLYDGGGGGWGNSLKVNGFGFMTRPWVLVAFHFTCHPGRTKLQQAGLAAEAVPSSMAAKVCFENNNKKRHFIQHFVHASFLH